MSTLKDCINENSTVYTYASISHLIHSFSIAISIWSARELILHFLSVSTRLFHDISVPFPFSHSFKTSIVILSGLPRQSSLITSTLFPALSSRRKIPNVSYLTPTCRGISRLSSSGRVGFLSVTGDKNEDTCTLLDVTYMCSCSNGVMNGGTCIHA